MFNLAFVLLNAIKQFMVQSTYITHIVVKINPPVLFLIAYYKWKTSFCSPVLQLDNDFKPIKLKYCISANNIADLFHMKTFDTWNMAAIRTNTLKVVTLELQVVMVYCCCSYFVYLAITNRCASVNYDPSSQIITTSGFSWQRGSSVGVVIK